MGFAELTQSTGWKMFMAKLYGLGAAVVIIGALFKIQHWPGASLMLTIGLLVEAVIFIFSAFEPLHEELDWTLVYPELAGMTDPDELDAAKETAPKTNAALERFDDLMGGLGGIDPNVIQNLGTSFDKLNITAASISDVTQASAVTSQYIQNVGAAAESVGNLSVSFQSSAAGLQDSATAISHSSSALTAIQDSSQGYATQLEGMNKNIAQLNAVYEMQLNSTNEQMQKSKLAFGDMEQMMENIRASVDETNRYREEMAKMSMTALSTISDSSQGYATQLEGVNKNIAQLNAAYELQVRNTNDQMQKTNAVYNDMEQMMENIKSSFEETNRVKDEMANLNRNLSNLNTIYGNMLSAMSFKMQ